MASVFQLDTLMVRLAMNASQYQRTIRNAQNDMESFAVRATNLGRSLTLYVTAPLMGMGLAAVNEFSKFDKAMTEAEAIFGGLEEEVRENMENVAKDLAMSGEVAWDPTQLAEGYEQLAAAGFNADQSIRLLPITSKFATAGMFDIAEATKILSDAVNAFGMRSDSVLEQERNMTKVADGLVMLANQTTTSVREAALSMMTDSAAQARLFGMELETLMAILGAYAASGKKAENAGHMAGRAMRLLADSHRKHGEVFEEHGIRVVDEATGEYRNFIGIIGDLEHAMAELTSPEKVALLNKLGFETLAQKSILPLIGMSEAMREMERDQRRAGGAMEAMAGIQMKSFANQSIVTLNHLKVMAIEIGELLAPALAKLYELIREGVDWWRSLSDGTKKTTLAIAGFAATIGPTILIVGQFAHALVNIKLLMGTDLANALGILVQRIGLLRAGLYGLAFAVGYYLVNKFSGAAEAARELNKALEETNRLNKMEFDRRFEEQDRIRERLGGIEDPEERKKALQVEVDRLQVFINQQLAMLRMEEKAVEGMKKSYSKDVTTTWLRKMFSGLEYAPIFEVDEARLKENRAVIDEWVDFALKLMNEVDKISAEQEREIARAPTELAKAVEKLEQELQEELETLGMTNDQLRIYKLMKEGATQADLAHANALSEAKTFAEQQADLAESIDELNKSLLEQQMALILSGAELEAWKLAMQGAYGYAAQAAIDLAKQNEAIKKYNDLQEEGKRLTEQVKTPLEKLEDAQNKYWELFQGEHITEETFNRLMEEAQKTYEEAQAKLEEPIKINFKTEGIDAVRTDSAQFAREMEAQRAFFAQPVKPVNAAGIGGGASGTGPVSEQGFSPVDLSDVVEYLEQIAENTKEPIFEPNVNFTSEGVF